MPSVTVTIPDTEADGLFQRKIDLFQHGMIPDTKGMSKTYTVALGLFGREATLALIRYAKRNRVTLQAAYDAAVGLLP